MKLPSEQRSRWDAEDQGENVEWTVNKYDDWGTFFLNTLFRKKQKNKLRVSQYNCLALEVFYTTADTCRFNLPIH